MIEPEVYFLRYAFPCAYVLKTIKKIDEETYQTLEDAAINKKVLPRGDLEKIFENAFKNMRIVAEELRKDIWDLRVIKAYFLRRHNEIIEKNPATGHTSKNLCKVHKAEIIEIKDDYLLVKYGEGGHRPVLRIFVPKAKVGDRVTIHYGYAVEKIK